MKRIFILGKAGSAKDFLGLVKGMGVLHPEKLMDAPDAQMLEGISRRLKEHWETIEKLSGFEKMDRGPKPTFEEVRKGISELNHLKDKREILSREISRQLVWGDFSPADIEDLKQKGIFIQLWKSRSKDIPTSASSIAHVIPTKRLEGFVHFITVSNKKLDVENSDEVSIPSRSLADMNSQREAISADIKNINNLLCSMSFWIDELKTDLKNERDGYEFLKAVDESYSDESVSVVSGWVPIDCVERVKNRLQSKIQGVAIHMRDPMPDEIVPVATKNNRFVAAFEPLLHLLGQPDYKSVDPASFFAPFMFLFFGICLGDIVYGAVMIAASLFMRRMLGKKYPQIIPATNLTILFGIATFIWGAITGSLVGLDPPLALKKMMIFNFSQDSGDPLKLFYITIGLGIVHLSIAFGISVVRSTDFQAKLAEAGKILVLWGGTLGLLKFKYWWAIFIAGIVLVFLFSAAEKNPFKRLGLGLWNVYGLSGLIGDVISYARLFGLGMATGAIASVVNLLASMCLKLPYAGYVLMVIVLIVGHSYNFIMGIIGSTVHPARLHAVEAFSKFTKMSGVEYKPI